jgi:hypothetical protein
MATNRPKKVSRQALVQRRLREHYRKHLIDVDGRKFNKLLGKSPEEGNTRGWSHGDYDGYLQAGCRCSECTDANTRAKNVVRQRKIAERREAERETVLTLLRTVAPGLDDDTLIRTAEAVLDSAVVTVGRGDVPKFEYGAEHLRLALRAVAADDARPLWGPEVAAAVIEGMTGK